jgi:hypothetical protein
MCPKTEDTTDDTTNDTSDVQDNLTINGMLLLENKALCNDVNYTLFRTDDCDHPERYKFKYIHSMKRKAIHKTKSDKKKKRMTTTD